MSELKDFDTFWLEKGQTLVNETFTNLKKHLKNQSNYLKALLGFYTFLGLTSSLITTTTDYKVYLAFILPYIILLLAQFKISVGQKAQLETLDLRSPLKINDAYNKLVLSLQEDVISAKRWVARATIAILVGGTASFYFLNKDKAAKAKLYKIEARADTISGYEDEGLKDFIKTQQLKVSKVKGENKVTVEAKFTKDKIIELTLLTTKDSTITKAIKIPKLVNCTMDISDIKELLNTKIK
ncbi:hypothetical protein [Olleya aquimaris]|uniref:Uncharacterized protein n=1 Tax=Olleya aquimaris TaxID=639310 RepID=A0A327RPI3_9FLAO|nr:hypothetical protein [Olleya aquimaris]RAJ17968.1 hypothetical protein LY08_00238 [Olleya aquimaris]